MPHYDLSKCERVAEDTYGGRYECSNVLPLDNDRLILAGGPIQGYNGGQPEWIYHSQWPSLHDGHAGPRSPEYPGQLIATTRVLGPGFKPKAGEAGELWAINSNLGLSYLFTADGLFVDTLFKYAKDGRRWNFPEHGRGMDVTDVNYIDECFNPTITQFDDGRIIMVVGKTHSSVVQVHGLDSIRRFTGGAIGIDKKDVGRIMQYGKDLAAWRQAQEKAELLFVRKAEKAPVIDGDFSDWKHPAWIVVQRERVAAGFGGREVDYTAAAVSCDRDNLYVALRSRARNVLNNEGGDIRHLFKTGGGLDIQLAALDPVKGRKQAAEGDVRILVAMVKGKLLAVRYRPVVPGTKEPVVYDSPVAETRVDSVDDVSGRIRAAVKPNVELPDNGNSVKFEQVEVSIPLDLLGWTPGKLSSTLGDIGVLVGDGGSTKQRIYWHNQATGLVSDIPGEARLEPSMWGPWKIEK